MNTVFTASSWPISYQANPEYLVIQSAQPLQVLTSAIIGKEQATTIVNRHVPKSYCPVSPRQETQTWLKENGFSLTDTVTLLTAAYIERGTFQTRENEFFRLAVWTTAGFGNATRAGKKIATHTWNPLPGTINIIIVIDGSLTSYAMVNAIITATEAKSAALQDLGVKDQDGHLATGTNTDAIVIASTQQSIGRYLHEYTGILSPLGSAIGELVYQTVYQIGLQELF
ncbi:adenosylcobinamide amidohydrolase [Thermoflavimicrobium daqui]|nr:adenosylcobinamide amidohydrolase [Thermoflavimicrobium daqui]